MLGPGLRRATGERNRGEAGIHGYYVLARRPSGRRSAPPPPRPPHPVVERLQHDPVLAQEIARPARFRVGHRLHAAERGCSHLHPRRTLHEHREERRLLDMASRGEDAVVRQHDRVLGTERARDDLALAIRDRHARPLAEERAIVVERRRIHVRDDERLRRRGEHRAIGRMRVHDRVHVGPRAIDPEVEARRRVRGAAAFERFQLVVDQHERLGPRLVEAQAERQRPIGVGLRAARRDLAGETRFVVLLGEDPGAGRERLAHLQCARLADRAEIERDVLEHVLELQRLAVFAHGDLLGTAVECLDRPGLPTA